jgi:hypothetical protein
MNFRHGSQATKMSRAYPSDDSARWLRRALPTTLAIFLVCFAASQSRSPGRAAEKNQGYVGSQSCAKCHSAIYDKYSRTDMGRSMSVITPVLLERVAMPVRIFDPKLDRHFEAYARDGALFQSESQTFADGAEVFRDTHKIDWLIGSGANGMGAIVRVGDFLLEAPLSFYARKQAWELSPGYQFGDYGFSRPILPGCIACHSGQPRPAQGGNGRFLDPPFTELAIGCENCHGPGEQHVLEMELSASSATGNSAIVNPAKLSPWLADNICMSCHQTGDARVLHPGKSYRDFRPGQLLDETLSIFIVPFDRESAPKDDLLEHYLSMRLSKCYRSSSGRLSCISCHDPHTQPVPSEAAAYFRAKCLACHTEKSCAVPQPLRQRKQPPDDCAGCHMPKRDVIVISHSVLTNHRIVATVEEPFPEIAFRRASTELPDLVHLSAAQETAVRPAPLTLLEAYGQVMRSHAGYRERYWTLARQLEPTHSRNILVLEALADWSLQKKTAEGVTKAIEYLNTAIDEGSTTPDDFEQLGTLLLAAQRYPQATGTLQKAIVLAPYDPGLYRVLASSYVGSGNAQEACHVAERGVQNFPQDPELRELSKKCPGLGKKEEQK